MSGNSQGRAPLGLFTFAFFIAGRGRFSQSLMFFLRWLGVGALDRYLKYRRAFPVSSPMRIVSS